MENSLPAALGLLGVPLVNLMKGFMFHEEASPGMGGLGGKGMMVGLSPRNLSSSSSEPRLQPSSAHRRERFKRRGCERVISCDQIGR